MKTKLKKYCKAGLLAACLVASAAMYALIAHPHITSGEIFMGLLAAGGLLAGTVTTTYKYPVSGTTPPTLLQALTANILTAVVNMADSDTVITLTHNWNLSTAELADLFPLVNVNIEGDATTTVQPIFLVSLTNSSVVTINKPTTVGTQGTFVCVLLRPHTIIR